jgi:ssDNA-binding Zn-finger/Zn-ribbon topoisomerase 1
MTTPRVIRTKPAPSCPDCGAKMVLRKPPPGKEWEPFWGCNRFPNCHGTRNIDSGGKPEQDEEDWSKP